MAWLKFWLEEIPYPRKRPKREVYTCPLHIGYMVIGYMVKSAIWSKLLWSQVGSYVYNTSLLI